METNFNFNSQVCTDKVQSERLLALGLKKETVDMALVPLMEWDDCTAQEYFTGEYVARTKKDAERYNLDYIPAWSLHRLIEMGFNSLALLEDADNEDEIFFMAYKNPFESMLEMFEWLIKEGYFNKEYLEE